VYVSDLVSGEAVLLELRVARLASRGLSFALDLLLQFFTLLIIFLILAAGGYGGFDDALSTAVTLVIIVAVMVGYPVMMETLSRGRTIGKIALGLRVVRTDGGPIRFRHALVRALAGFFVDFWAVGVFGAVAVIVSLSSKNSQRVGDMLAGTLVIRERVPTQHVPVVQMPPPLAGWASELHVSALPNDLALAVRQYLGRVHQLSPNAAATLGHNLAMDVSAHLGAPVPHGVPVWAYLAAVLAERRNREEGKLRNPVVQSTNESQWAAPQDPPFQAPS
jgi:uncharacterized RDD family membrane protein YckC